MTWKATVSYLSVALQSFVEPWPLFQFLDLFTQSVGPLWTGDQPIRRPLPAHRTAQTQNKCTETFMPQVGFKPMIPVFEWAKTFHALDCGGHCDWPTISYLELFYFVLQVQYHQMYHRYLSTENHCRISTLMWNYWETVMSSSTRFVTCMFLHCVNIKLLRWYDKLG
jgi:hypothetical protein